MPARGVDGPPADFVAVFERHHQDALRLAYLLCRNATMAEDAVSEALARVYVRWRRGGIDDPRAYLRAAVVNEVRRTGKRAGRERAALHLEHEGAPKTQSDRVADRDVLRRALSTLPPRQREAVVLRFYADLSEAATAAAMGCSVGSVKAHTSRGLQRLRDLAVDTKTRRASA